MSEDMIMQVIQHTNERESGDYGRSMQRLFDRVVLGVVVVPMLMAIYSAANNSSSWEHVGSEIVGVFNAINPTDMLLFSIWVVMLSIWMMKR